LSDLQGIFAAAITPFDAQGVFQPDWQAQHFAWLQQHGVEGVLVCGTNGEGPSLSYAERCAVIDAAVCNRGALQLAAGTGTTSVAETIALSRYALEAGVDAALLLPPYYFRDADEDGLIAYFRAVCDGLPPDGRMLFYHIPRYTGVPISSGLIRSLRESHPQQCYGLKDTGGDATHTGALVQEFPDLCVMGGSDHLVADNLRVGVRGQISGLANAIPDLLSGLFRAFRSGEPVDEWQAQITAVQRIAKQYPLHAAIKLIAADRMGLPPIAVKPPLRNLTAAEQSALRAELATLAL
jgi:4-hydroxy-tetrahydrodipicolinate synthase